MSNDPSPRIYQLPWPAAAVALTSFAVLAPAASGYLLLGTLALALLASYLVPARLGGNSWQGWMVRLILFGVVLFLNSNDTSTGAMMVFDPAVVHSFGELCAVEMVVQAWRRRPIGPPGATAVVLSALILIAGCDTFSPTLIRVLAPLYTVFMVLALRSFYPRVQNERCRMTAPMLLGAGALILALVAGGAVSYGLWTYRSQLMEWSLGLLGGRRSLPGVGVSNEPTLGPVFDAGGSSERVLRIDGLSETAHFRMADFETYNHGAWEPPADRRRQIPVSAAELHADAPGQRLHVTRYGDTHRLVYAPLSAAGIVPAPGSSADWNRVHGGPLHAGPEGDGLYTYDVVLNSDPDYQGPLCFPPDAASRRRCLAVPPEIDQAVRALAHRIGAHRIGAHRIGARLSASQTLAEERVQAVVQYLLSHYHYSLETRLASGDPISRFLLSANSGHCQYFAASAVMLLRCLGVPSRYVDGYYVHEQDGPDSEVVRQQDAHAWTECWIDGKGWITVDATPPDGRPDHTGAAVSFFQKLKERLQDLAAAARAWISRLPRWTPAAIVAIVGMVVLAIQAWRRLRRRRVPPAAGFAYAGPGGDLVSIAARFERLLQLSGLPCPETRPWQEHLSAELNHGHTPSAAGTPEPAISIDLSAAAAFVRKYNTVRFGGAVTPDAAAQLGLLLDEMDTRNSTARG